MIKCPYCKSKAIAYLRYDSDWGTGGNWDMVNEKENYTPDQLEDFENNNRRDVETYYCYNCNSCFGDKLPAEKPEVVPTMTREELIKEIISATDKIGIELRVWKEDYFGRKEENELVERLVDHLLGKVGKVRLPGSISKCLKIFAERYEGTRPDGYCRCHLRYTDNCEYYLAVQALKDVEEMNK